jgi:hypothetical protein
MSVSGGARFLLARFALAAAALLAAFASAAATAQTLLVTPPEKMMVSPGGVDMRSGRYAYSQTDLAIGGDAGLALTRTLSQQVVGHANPFANFSHNFDLMLVMKSVHIQTGDLGNSPGNPDTQVEIAFGGLSQTFQSAGTATGYDLVSHAGYARLTYTSPDGKRENPAAIYTFQTGDGTSAVFRPVGSFDCSDTLRCAYVSQLTHADGTRLTFEYDSGGGANATRLRSVTSSRGYALLLEYGGGGVSKACVLNLAFAAKPASNVCPAGAATATYAYDGAAGETRLATATDPAGAVSGFVNAVGSIGFVRPGQSAPWLTNRFTRTQVNDDGLYADIVDSQSYADGQSYTYGYDHGPYVPNHVATIAGGSFWNARGEGTSVAYDFPIKPGTGPGEPCLRLPCTQDNLNSDGTDSTVYQMTPGPKTVTDALGRVTAYDYCDPQALANLPSTYHHRCYVMAAPVSSTDPSGIKTFYTWDYSTHTLLGTHQVATDPALADLVRSATYNCTPATIRSCEKPLTVTDARGNVTTYTYAPEHGGVLTETQPAVNGVTAQKRYAYQQRTAWISNGAGGYVGAGPPAWLLAGVSTCKAGNPASSGTGCALGASDEVVTTYDYGPDAGPSNLLLRGTVVDPGGLNLRTCYGYDAAGNKLSETKPRAGLGSCP